MGSGGAERVGLKIGWKGWAMRHGDGGAGDLVSGNTFQATKVKAIRKRWGGRETERDKRGDSEIFNIVACILEHGTM